jgi:hypothetical protein
MSEAIIPPLAGEGNLRCILGVDGIYWKVGDRYVLQLEGVWLSELGSDRFEALEALFESFGEKIHQAISLVKQGEDDIAVCLRALASHGGER